MPASVSDIQDSPTPAGNNQSLAEHHQSPKLFALSRVRRPMVMPINVNECLRHLIDHCFGFRELRYSNSSRSWSACARQYSKSSTNLRYSHLLRTTSLSGSGETVLPRSLRLQLDRRPGRPIAKNRLTSRTIFLIPCFIASGTQFRNWRLAPTATFGRFLRRPPIVLRRLIRSRLKGGIAPRDL